MSTANPKIAAIREQVRQSYDELSALLDGPIGVLYVEKLYQTPTENEWTVMENLAHIAEFLPYWADEGAKLVARPGQPFGRTMEDAGRLAALSEHGRDSLARVRAALPTSYAHLDQVFSQLSDSDLELTGHHSRRGEKTLAWFIEEFIVRHLRDHVTQIRACLQAIS
ncbi:MAG TPA: DinB family protein [Ktedonobacteraceae bacterium]